MHSIVEEPKGFRCMSMFLFFDEHLTEGPEHTSRLVAWAQGFYGSAGQPELGPFVTINIVFTAGKFFFLIYFLFFILF